MPASDWPNAIAHVDADCFYASCELLRRPDLKGVPVCVMSSQDACIVAKTYDAKAAGITTGMPVWEARKRMPEAVFLPADFRYYGQISGKLFAVLNSFSPAVEEYSIDEGFMDMNGLRALHRKTYRQIADDIREAIFRQVGVTASVGLSVTRTLAKMASEYSKPNGTTIVADGRIREFLQHVSARDIPGIGANRAALLDKFGIRSGAEFAGADKHLLGRLLGKAGTDLWHELNGTPIYRVEPDPRPPKSVARTASMGQVTGDKATVHAHLVHHAMRLSLALMEKRITAKYLSVFLTLESFDKQALTSELPYPTADYFLLAQQAGAALDALFDPARQYRACGLIATGIAIRQAGNFDLFQQAERQREEKHLKLLEALHGVNRKFGKNTITVCVPFDPGRKGEHARLGYPLLECE
jgi:DNA polymerase-4/DNA polymerase V